MRTLLSHIVTFALGASLVLSLNRLQLTEGVHAQQFPFLFVPPPQVPALGVAVPQIMPLLHNDSSDSMIQNTGRGPGVIHLDGVEMDHNVLESPAGVHIVYGGGAYRLTNIGIRGAVSFEMTGAAANTVHLLRQFGILRGNEDEPIVVLPPQAASGSSFRPRSAKR